METTQKLNQQKNKTRKIVMLGLLSAISTILMYIEFPLPLLPPFLKIDISVVPILISTFIFGPVEAIAIILLKNIVHLFSTQTGGIGQLADFIILSSFIIVVSFVSNKLKTKNKLKISLLCGIVAIAIIGAITNKYMLIPFYSKIMPVETIIEICNKVNPMINSINTYIFFGVIPFNIIKGSIISLITVFIYKKLYGSLKSSFK